MPLLRVADEVRRPDRLKTFRRFKILPSASETAATLATLLRTQPAWSTGLSDEWTADSVGDWVLVLGGVPKPALPVARLIKAMHAQDSVSGLLPNFLRSVNGSLSEVAYATVLARLAGEHESGDSKCRDRVENVFLRYLRAIAAAGDDFVHGVLAAEGVQLLNESGQWKRANQLAFSADNIVPEDLLCSDHCDALGSLRLAPVDADITRPDQSAESFEDGLRQTGTRLRDYFRLWAEYVPPEVIGAFLCVLGDAGGIRELAEDMLEHGRRTVDETRKAIADLATPRMSDQQRQEENRTTQAKIHPL